jgi:hypothetical protein
MKYIQFEKLGIPRDTTYWQNSKGCLREMETAKKLGIHLREGLEAK